MAAPNSCAAAFPAGASCWRSKRNLGFGGGSNAGFRAAAERHRGAAEQRHARGAGFPRARCSKAFAIPLVFAVSCQIFFSDPTKLREETGLTQGWWQDGGLRVRHRIDPAVDDLFPCFYGGGGSCAFDRAKFLELGGFDQLLAPFYLEDTDLGYLAWKRGWKVLYQPRSVVYHEHRGTIGKRFSEDRIQAVLKKNYLLFCWKNIHEWPRLASHFCLHLGGRGAQRDLRRRSRPRRISTAAVARLPPIAAARSVRAGAPAALAGIERQPKPSAVPWAAISATASTPMEADPGAPARAVRFSLSHLPAGARRRRLHVPDAARAGPTGRSARGRHAGLALAGSGQSGAARILRLRRSGSCVRTGRPRGIGIARAARRARIRQRRSGMADPPPALPASESMSCSSNTRPWRSTAATYRRIATRPVRARCLLPIHRPRLGPHDARPAGRGEGPHGVSARAAL